MGHAQEGEREKEVRKNAPSFFNQHPVITAVATCSHLAISGKPKTGLMEFCHYRLK